MSHPFEPDWTMHPGVILCEILDDREKQLVYLAVDWAGFRDAPEATEDPSCE